MKKRTRLLLAAVAAAMVMAGCSTGGPSGIDNISTDNQEKVMNQDVQNNKRQNNPQEAEISENEAFQIALADAKLTADELTHSKVRLDYDDGVLEYEVDLRVGYQEYDYDIDANTGDIRSKDVDIDD